MELFEFISWENRHAISFLNTLIYGKSHESVNDFHTQKFCIIQTLGLLGILNFKLTH